MWALVTTVYVRTILTAARQLFDSVLFTQELFLLVMS